MFLILGGGFGLYGYLPALVHGCGQSVLLPRRYRPQLIERDDIRALQDVVLWADDEQQAIDQVDAVVISKRPQDQVDWVKQCLQRKALVDMVLEKPLAPSPEQAIALMDRLEQAEKNFRVAYLFRLTPWGRALIDRMSTSQDAQELHLNWHFQAHHYTHGLNNWKRSSSHGGGVLRFYGIHLIALLAEIGYTTAVQSTLRGAHADEAQSWQATLSGPGLPPCRLQVDSNNPKNKFCVLLDDSNSPLLVDLKEPFSESVPNAIAKQFDSRSALLTKVCQSLKEDCKLYYPWYRRTLNLWAQIEQQTVHQELPIDASGPPFSPV